MSHPIGISVKKMDYSKLIEDAAELAAIYLEQDRTKCSNVIDLSSYRYDKTIKYVESKHEQEES